MNVGLGGMLRFPLHISILIGGAHFYMAKVHKHAGITHYPRWSWVAMLGCSSGQGAYKSECGGNP